MKIVFLIFFIVFCAQQALCFDRMICSSELKDWVVILKRPSKVVVLNPTKKSVILTEKESTLLFIKTPKNNLVATVFPWNSLYVRKPESTQKLFKIETHENLSSFDIIFTDKKTSENRSISCDFSF